MDVVLSISSALHVLNYKSINRTYRGWDFQPNLTETFGSKVR